MNASSPFDYDAAFSRNLGLVQPSEQQRLRAARVAIAGLGGVGGVHATTLARTGIGHFHLADFDEFEVHNINRQAGAAVSTFGQRKADVMARMVSDINPSAEVKLFEAGVTSENIDEFLNGVDVLVDGLDFFAVDVRDMMYRAAHKKGLPIVVAGPLGASSAMLVFMPGGMTWHEYFAIDLAKNEFERYVLFALGNAPSATHMPYMDRTYVNLAEKRGPSLGLAVQLCAGVVAAETLKILLQRGSVLAVPYFHQFDAYRNKYVIGKLRWGNRGPLQRFKFWLFRKLYAPKP